MVSNLVPRGLTAAFAGATLAVLASSAPSSAFTLNSPSLEAPVATADIDHVYWRRGWGGGWHRGWGWHGGWHGGGWGWHRPWGYHPWGWHRPWGWGWHRPVYGFYGGPVRHCWVGPWGGVRCRWW